MPGSPPISTTEPGMSPPPSTRSSSPTPVATRGAEPVSTSASAMATFEEGAPDAGATRGASSGGAPIGSSISVSQEPQPGQRPSIWGLWLPHSVQT
jgi:hypothetical protein